MSPETRENSYVLAELAFYFNPEGGSPRRTWGPVSAEGYAFCVAFMTGGSNFGRPRPPFSMRGYSFSGAFLERGSHPGPWPCLWPWPWPARHVCLPNGARIASLSRPTVRNHEPCRLLASNVCPHLNAHGSMCSRSSRLTAQESQTSCHREFRLLHLRFFTSRL